MLFHDHEISEYICICVYVCTIYKCVVLWIIELVSKWIFTDASVASGQILFQNMRVEHRQGLSRNGGSGNQQVYGQGKALTFGKKNSSRQIFISFKNNSILAHMKKVITFEGIFYRNEIFFPSCMSSPWALVQG